MTFFLASRVKHENDSILCPGMTAFSSGVQFCLVALICEECKTQNYTVSKNKKNTTERLELNKYCPKCRKNTTHKEKK